MTTQNPFISVIIPVYNAQRSISLCLEALLEQTYPQEDVEIIVMDNDSTDATLSIARKFPVKVLTKAGMTISALRNEGAALAKGDLLAFIDADCVAPKNWLEQAVGLFKRYKAAAVGCWYALPKDTTLLERTWDMLTALRREKSGPIDWLPSGDLIVRSNAFLAVKGFDPHLTTSEDVDICRRLSASGYVVYSHQSVAVKHLGNAKTWKQFFDKEKWRGEGVLQNYLRKFPRVEIDKALIFAMVSLLCMAGMMAGGVWWAACGQAQLFVVSMSGMLLIPFLMTLKILFKQPQWHRFFLLLPLLTLYGLARGWSISSRKVWKSA